MRKVWKTSAPMSVQFAVGKSFNGARITNNMCNTSVKAARGAQASLHRLQQEEGGAGEDIFIPYPVDITYITTAHGYGGSSRQHKRNTNEVLAVLL
jgi:hypothetical protein